MSGTEEEKHRSGHRAWGLLALLLFLAIGTCSLWQHWNDGTSGKNGNGRGNSSGSGIDSARIRDSLARLDSLNRQRQRDSLANAAQRRSGGDRSMRGNTGRRSGNLRRHRQGANGLAGTSRRHHQDSSNVLQKFRPDSPTQSDSARHAESPTQAGKERRDLYIVADPAGGVHTSPVDVAVIPLSSSVTPLCALDDSTNLKVCRDLIHIDRDHTLWITAADSLGVRAPLQKLVYHIDPDASRCGPRRVLVPLTDGRAVCVDAYEYPNDPNQMPRTSVNWKQASSLCARLGKRLCGRDELQLACQGPQEWRYPYGDTHITGHCQDGGTDITYENGHPGCRSWWGAYDLVGNAWEWTSSPYGSNAYWVFGGYYGDGPSASCQEVKHSFYPQNRYGSVGFRCCEDAP